MVTHHEASDNKGAVSTARLAGQGEAWYPGEARGPSCWDRAPRELWIMVELQPLLTQA